MAWYQVLTTALIPIILALAGIIWRQNTTIQRVNEEHKLVIKNDLEKRIVIVEADSKEIKSNYLDRFAEVNLNITNLDIKVTDRLARIETSLNGLLH